jgi:hypothetical protein
LRLQRDLTAVEVRLGEVRRKYDRQLQRLQDRKEALATMQAECEQEEEELARQRQSFEQREEERSRRGAKLRRQVAMFQLETTIIGSVLRLFTSDQDDKEHCIPSILSLLSSGEELLFQEGIAPFDQQYDRSDYKTRQHSVRCAELQLQKTKQSYEDLKRTRLELLTESRHIADIGLVYPLTLTLTLTLLYTYTNGYNSFSAPTERGRE